MAVSRVTQLSQNQNVKASWVYEDCRSGDKWKCKICKARVISYRMSVSIAPETRYTHCDQWYQQLPCQHAVRRHKHPHSAACVVTSTGKFDHITPVLRILHWLPIRQRIQFKLAMIKCLHGLALSYLADDCILVSTAASRRHLHSADTMKLSVRRTRTVNTNVCCCHLEQSTNRA